MKRRGHVLVPVGSKAKLPKLQRVLQQRRGVFLVEFHWSNKEGERNHHVVAVNCNLRLVFCNTSVRCRSRSPLRRASGSSASRKKRMTTSPSASTSRA